MGTTTLTVTEILAGTVLQDTMHDLDITSAETIVKSQLHADSCISSQIAGELIALVWSQACWHYHKSHIVLGIGHVFAAELDILRLDFRIVDDSLFAGCTQSTISYIVTGTDKLVQVMKTDTAKLPRFWLYTAPPKLLVSFYK